MNAILEGHSGNVNCAEFCPHYMSTVVSASDDRTFRVGETMFSHCMVSEIKQDVCFSRMIVFVIYFCVFLCL